LDLVEKRLGNSRSLSLTYCIHFARKLRKTTKRVGTSIGATILTGIREELN
jgi:hypothetical protein